MIHLYIQETNANISSVTYEARLENVSSVSDDSGHWNTPPELKACVYLVTVRASQRLPPPPRAGLFPLKGLNATRRRPRRMASGKKVFRREDGRRECGGGG